MPGNPLTDPNWAATTTETIVRIVDAVRQQTTTKVVYAARGLVFGIIVFLLSAIAVVIVMIGLIRGFTELFDLFLPRPKAVYWTYFTLGLLFSIAGLVLFRLRNSATS
jgi:uncharacterized protein YacL